MSEYRTHVPVFLPGNERAYEEIAGMATISDDGTIEIKLQHVEHAAELVRLYKGDKIIAVAFDYIRDRDKPVETPINHPHA